MCVDIRVVKWCVLVCVYVHMSHTPSAATSPVLCHSHTTISINLHQMVCSRTREVCVRVLGRKVEREEDRETERSTDRNYNSRMIAMPTKCALCFKTEKVSAREREGNTLSTGGVCCFTLPLQLTDRWCVLGRLRPGTEWVRLS